MIAADVTACSRHRVGIEATGIREVHSRSEGGVVRQRDLILRADTVFALDETRLGCADGNAHILRERSIFESEIAPGAIDRPTADGMGLQFELYTFDIRVTNVQGQCARRTGIIRALQ